MAKFSGDADLVFVYCLQINRSGGSWIFQAGTSNPKGGVPTNQIFAKNYMKMKEIGQRGGRAFLSPQLHHTLVNYLSQN